MKTLLFFALGIYAAYLLDRLILFVLEPDYLVPHRCDGGEQPAKRETTPLVRAIDCDAFVSRVERWLETVKGRE